MHRLIIFILLLCSFAFAKSSHSGQHHSSGSHSSKSQASKTKNSKSKPVHVRGYTRKNGTYVAPHDRSLPGTASPESHSGRTYRNHYVVPRYTLHSSVERDRRGRIKRSASAKAAFQRQSPCPSTGKMTGHCPGYVVDHVKPLECGGADMPSNMQWQTMSDAKAKDKAERNCRF